MVRSTRGQFFGVLLWFQDVGRKGDLSLRRYRRRHLSQARRFRRCWQPPLSALRKAIRVGARDRPCGGSMSRLDHHRVVRARAQPPDSSTLADLDRFSAIASTARVARSARVAFVATWPAEQVKSAKSGLTATTTSATATTATGHTADRERQNQQGQQLLHFENLHNERYPWPASFRPSNSTPRAMMCKRNASDFFSHPLRNRNIIAMKKWYTFQAPRSVGLNERSRAAPLATSIVSAGASGWEEFRRRT